jgi:DUF1009 family protein
VQRIGLIAGNGRFPFLVAEQIRKNGDQVVVLAIKEETDPAIEKLADTIHWLNLGQLQKLIDLLHDEKTDTVIMSGQVKHVQIFKNLSLDWRAVRLMGALINKKTDTILGRIAEELAKEGITLLPSNKYLVHLMADKGLIAGSKPSGAEKDDIDFGFRMAKQIAGLDIGQTVVVKDKSVVAVESVEGTNECIKRAALLAGDNVIAVKVAKPNQDWRFDVPVIGIDTVNTLAEARARLIAVEAGATLILDKDAVIDRANALSVTIVGVK